MIDGATWCAVHEQSATRGPRTERAINPRTKYALMGLARCATCGSAIVYQSKEEVEAALVDQLQTYVLGEDALAMVIGQVRAEIEAQLPQRHQDIAVLEADLASVRVEQKRLAKAVALSDDVPELVMELQQRSARIRTLKRSW